MDISAVDLFCGAGGLTYGLEQAGIDVAAGVDIDPACAHPYEANNAATFYEEDLAEVAAERPGWVSDLLDDDADIQLVAGGPPCQPYSNLNNGQTAESHEKSGLVSVFADLVAHVDPDVVVMENVYGVRNVDGYEYLEETLDANGFYFNEEANRRVNCPDYGIPQQRKRWITLASKLGPIELNPPSAVSVDRDPVVEDWIGDLPRLEAGERDDTDPLHAARDLSDTNLERIRISEPGGTWKDWIDKGHKDLVADCHEQESGASYTAPYSRMEGDSVGPTITTQFYNYGSGRFGHYDTDQDRALSLREGARLQTFPEDYEFVEGTDPSEVGIVSLGRLIGNAVPPKLAEVIGQSVRRHVSGARQMTVLDYAEPGNIPPADTS
jgi:DNA (cytosine-5)-methyltransferase 1